MSHLDSCRRAGSIVLVVACLLLVPGAAMARFTDRQAPALSVATGFHGEAHRGHRHLHLRRPGEHRVRADRRHGLHGRGALGARCGLLTPGNPAPVVTTTSRAQSLTASIPDDKAANVWTVAQSVLGNWTGPAYSRQVTCTRKSSNAWPALSRSARPPSSVHPFRAMAWPGMTTRFEDRRIRGPATGAGLELISEAGETD